MFTKLTKQHIAHSFVSFELLSSLTPISNCMQAERSCYPVLYTVEQYITHDVQVPHVCSNLLIFVDEQEA
jgi:hypothetical protein